MNSTDQWIITIWSVMVIAGWIYYALTLGPEDEIDYEKKLLKIMQGQKK